MTSTHTKIAFSCRIDVILEVHVGLAHASEPVLTLVDADTERFTQEKRLKPRGSVLDNMLDGEGRFERVLAVVAGESKACGHGVGNVDPSKSKPQLCGPLASCTAVSAASVPKSSEGVKFQPPERPRNIGHLNMGAGFANPNSRSPPANQ